MSPAMSPVAVATALGIAGTILGALVWLVRLAYALGVRVTGIERDVAECKRDAAECRRDVAALRAELMTRRGQLRMLRVPADE